MAGAGAGAGAAAGSRVGAPQMPPRRDLWTREITRLRGAPSRACACVRTVCVQYCTISRPNVCAGDLPHPCLTVCVCLQSKPCSSGDRRAASATTPGVICAHASSVLQPGATQRSTPRLALSRGAMAPESNATATERCSRLERLPSALHPPPTAASRPAASACAPAGRGSSTTRAVPRNRDSSTRTPAEAATPATDAGSASHSASSGAAGSNRSAAASSAARQACRASNAALPPEGCEGAPTGSAAASTSHNSIHTAVAPDGAGRRADTARTAAPAVLTPSTFSGTRRKPQPRGGGQRSVTSSSSVVPPPPSGPVVEPSPRCAVAGTARQRPSGSPLAPSSTSTRHLTGAAAAARQRGKGSLGGRTSKEAEESARERGGASTDGAGQPARLGPTCAPQRVCLACGTPAAPPSAAPSPPPPPPSGRAGSRKVSRERTVTDCSGRSPPTSHVCLDAAPPDETRRVAAQAPHAHMSCSQASDAAARRHSRDAASPAQVGGAGIENCAVLHASNGAADSAAARGEPTPYRLASKPSARASIGHSSGGSARTCGGGRRRAVSCSCVPPRAFPSHKRAANPGGGDGEGAGGGRPTANAAHARSHAHKVGPPRLQAAHARREARRPHLGHLGRRRGARLGGGRDPPQDVL